MGFQAIFGKFQIINKNGKTKVTLDEKEISPSLLWFLPSPIRIFIEILGLISLLAWILSGLLMIL